MKVYSILFFSSFFMLSSFLVQAQNGVITIGSASCHITVPELISSHSEYESFKIISKDCTIKSINITVFNRWGNELYKSTDINFEWTGLYKTSKKKKAKEVLAPTGTYFWVINVEFETGTEVLKEKSEGYLQILR